MRQISDYAVFQMNALIPFLKKPNVPIGFDFGSGKVVRADANEYYPHNGFAYFGSSFVPVIVNPASDLAEVSSGCAPPMLRVYLPARIERLP